MASALEIAPSSLDHEAAWWDDCANTFHEEQKQLVYARYMGLYAEWAVAHPPQFNLGGRSVVDLGGGPSSLLLKCVNGGRMTVVDPCRYPDWVSARYRAHGVTHLVTAAERFTSRGGYDEVWIYNVLQHVENPKRVIEVARQLAPRIRIFDWVEVPADEFHPHVLHEAELDEWLRSKGRVEHVDDGGCVGWAYYGVIHG